MPYTSPQCRKAFERGDGGGNFYEKFSPRFLSLDGRFFQQLSKVVDTRKLTLGLVYDII